MASNQETAPRNVLPELIIPAIALVFAVYYLTTITEVPWIAQASAIVVSTLLLLSIAAFAARTYLRVKRGSEIISVRQLPIMSAQFRVINLKRVILFGLTVAYVAALPYLGFSLATFFLIFAGIIVLSSLKNSLRAFLIALACTAVGYVAFIVLFKTRFPFGPIEHLLKGIV